MLKKDNFIFIILCFGLISILFCFVDVFWKINVFYKVFSVIQFPWRFYMFASFFFILVVSLFIKNVHFNKLIKLLFVYLLVVFIVNISMYSINVYVNEPKKNEIMVGEYLPEGFNLNIVDDYFNDDILYERKNNVLSVSIIKKDDYVEVPLIYYKGYVACGDRCYETFKTDNGLVGIYVDSDVENLDVYYYGTRIYNFTKFVSVLGIFVLIYIIKKYH